MKTPEPIVKLQEVTVTTGEENEHVLLDLSIPFPSPYFTVLFQPRVGFLKTTYQCEKDRARVLVHCMSGKSRSPAIVIAFLMKSKGWRLAQSYQWVKKQRPSVELTQAVYEQLQEYEQKIFGSNEDSPVLPVFQSSSVPSFSFGFPKPNDPVPVPAFNSPGATSIFARPALEVAPHEFTFGGGQTQKNPSGLPFGENIPNTTNNDVAMDGS